MSLTLALSTSGRLFSPCFYSTHRLLPAVGLAQFQSGVVADGCHRGGMRRCGSTEWGHWLGEGSVIAKENPRGKAGVKLGEFRSHQDPAAIR